MTIDELYIYLKIAGGIVGFVLMVLFGIIGWGAKMAIDSITTGMKTISLQLSDIKMAFAKTNEEVTTAKAEIIILRERADGIDDFKTTLFKDYKLIKR